MMLSECSHQLVWTSNLLSDIGFGNSRTQDDQYFLDCIILCPRNDEVHDISEAILQQFNPTTEIHMLRSVDSVSEEGGMHHAYPAEFL